MKTLFKTLLIGIGLATCLAPIVINKVKAETVTTAERKGLNTIKSQNKTMKIQYIGGLPLVTEYYGNPFGLTPKEYGIRFANGKSRKHKTNKKHRSHLYRVSNSRTT